MLLLALQSLVLGRHQFLALGAGGRIVVVSLLFTDHCV
jgi:hypothetical protein